jgi:hypothetical protein
MKRVLMGIIMMCVMLAGAETLALDSPGRTRMSKHQMVSQVIDCMKRRMYADRAISYNEAAKICKAQIERQNDSSGPLVASDAQAKP